MSRLKIIIPLFFVLILAASSTCGAGDICRLRIFFGLSLPDGGAVSLRDWNAFEQEEIAGTFDGFNVVDSTGYYKGQMERSKVVTVVTDEKGMQKAKELAKSYARKFEQEAVMIVKIPVQEWLFIGPEEEDQKK